MICFCVCVLAAARPLQDMCVCVCSGGCELTLHVVMCVRTVLLLTLQAAITN